MTLPPLPTPHQDALAAILAEVDAIHLPIRDPAASYWAAAWLARWSYRQAGVPWRSSAKADQNARKAAERTLKHLAQTGYLVRIHPRGKMTGARLTDAGDDHARAMAGLPTLHKSLKHLATLATRPGRWVPECAIDKRPWGPALLALEDELLPLLTRGLAESNADAHRKVCYRATPAGLVAARKPPAPVGPLPAADEDLRDEYLFGLQGALASLKGQPPPPREIGAIPLPCAWPSDDPPAPTTVDLATMAKVLWGRKAPTADPN